MFNRNSNYSPMGRGSHWNGYERPRYPNGGGTIKNNNARAHRAEVYGSPFHNPYTFIPFPNKSLERRPPTPLTIDEVEKDRFTGLIEVTLKTKSPLLTPDQQKERGEKNKPGVVAENKALRIGDDVIVPASAMRGCLRSLTGIISGSALDYVDDGLFLCQGRDANLGKDNLYLAIVETPGNETKPGVVKYGCAIRLETSQLTRILKKTDDAVWKEYSGMESQSRELWLSSDFRSASEKEDESHSWRVKVSGKKINRKKPYEGAFNVKGAKTMELPPEMWRDFIGRHRNAQKNSLHEGDVVWLEPKEEGQPIDGPNDVKSIQWARWGRHGINFLEKLRQKYPWMLPDSLKDDGKVDITSDLFGCIPGDKKSFPAFSGRVRPENLVFPKGTCFWNDMPVLSSPHPGCTAFYADGMDYDKISLEDGFRGYKVYRTSLENSEDAPWKFKNQPVYDRDKAKCFGDCSSMTAKCELLNANTEGRMGIAVRSLSQKELALILLVLSCDLRIGGGKSLGLGHCKVKKIVLRNEDGEVKETMIDPQVSSLPEEIQKVLEKSWVDRAKFYCATQVPVAKMRYPRAGKMNNNGMTVGGMNWFSEFAPPQKANGSDLPKGLSTKKVTSFFASKYKFNANEGNQIKAQGLPYFDPEHPDKDLLYGYDMYLDYPERCKEVNDCKEWKSNRDSQKNDQRGRR